MATLETLQKKMDTKFETFEERVDAKFEAFEKKMDTRFESLETMIADLAQGVQGGFERVEGRLDGLEMRVGTLELGLGKLTTKVYEMSDTLDTVVNGLDKDAVTLADHGRRIRRLEQKIK